MPYPVKLGSIFTSGPYELQNDVILHYHTTTTSLDNVLLTGWTHSLMLSPPYTNCLTQKICKYDMSKQVTWCQSELKTNNWCHGVYKCTLLLVNNYAALWNALYVIQRVDWWIKWLQYLVVGIEVSITFSECYLVAHVLEQDQKSYFTPGCDLMLYSLFNECFSFLSVNSNLLLTTPVVEAAYFSHTFNARREFTYSWYTHSQEKPTAVITFEVGR